MGRKISGWPQPVSLHGGAEVLVELQQRSSVAEQDRRTPGRPAVDRWGTLEGFDETECHLERVHRNGFSSLPRRIDEFGSQTLVVSNVMQRDVEAFLLEPRPFQMIFTNEPMAEPSHTNGRFGIWEQSKE